MSAVTVSIRISADDYLRWYQGSARNVLAYSADGKRVQFPASILQKFVQRDGIQGTFRIHFDAAGKFTAVEKID